MLLVSAVHIALGWIWHTSHRVRHHWTLRREGALVAAAAVALIGTIDMLRGARHSDPNAGRHRPTATLTATATPAVTESTPLEIKPAEPPATVAALPSPPADGAAADTIGQKIMERLGDEPATASIAPQQPAADPIPARPPVARKTPRKGKRGMN
jgi:hypothetical protein